jgi:transposase-like protein
LDHLPRKADDDCLQELRWLYDPRDVEESRRDLAAWSAKWGGRYQKLVDWVEETIEDTFTFKRRRIAAVPRLPPIYRLKAQNL